MTVKPFYIRSGVLTDNQINGVLDKAVACGAMAYECKERASLHGYSDVYSSNYLYFGVDDDNHTYITNNMNIYGVGAVELTIDQVDEHLGITTPKSNTTKEYVRERVITTLRKFSCENYVGDTLAEYGLDSLDEVELCFELEEEFGTEVTDATATAFTTVTQVVDYILNHVDFNLKFNLKQKEAQVEPEQEDTIFNKEYDVVIEQTGASTPSQYRRSITVPETGNRGVHHTVDIEVFDVDHAYGLGPTGHNILKALCREGKKEGNVEDYDYNKIMFNSLLIWKNNGKITPKRFWELAVELGVAKEI
jgi:acyl carrier protein